MAQRVKCLFRNHEDLRSDPQHVLKGVEVNACGPSAEGQRQGNPAGLPGHTAELKQ